MPSFGDGSRQVWMYPTEYLTYGAGDAHAISFKPDGGKHYKIADHLGSTRIVIDENGVLQSQLEYAPFGEQVANYGVNGSSAPRKGFIDKETDGESGLGDYSARKYDDELGRFTSVDALWEKYRSLSPYQYSNNNPLIIKDPTGLKFDFSASDGDEEAIEEAKAAVAEAINYLIENGAEEEAHVLIELRDRKDIVVKMDVAPKNSKIHGGRYDPSGEILWHPATGQRTKEGKMQSPALVLLHEAAHAHRHLTAKADRNPNSPHVASRAETKYYHDIRENSDKQYHTIEERRVVTQYETPAAMKLGEGTRDYYLGLTLVRVAGPTSREAVEE